MSTGSERLRATLASDPELPWFPPTHYLVLGHHDGMFEYFLTFPQKVFVFLEDPSSSVMAQLNSIFVIVVIFLSGLVFLLSTDPSVTFQPSSCSNPVCDDHPVDCPGKEVCEPIAPMSLYYIDAVCVAIFTLDYVLRVSLVSVVPPRISSVFNTKEWDLQHQGSVPDPTFSTLVTLRRYLLKPMNLIDLVAILPFYIAFFTPSGASLTIFRILRLGRILRLTKAGKNNSSMIVLISTINGSKEILSMLFFYILLCVCVIAALVYQFEVGDFKVTVDYPDGAYFRPTVNMDGQEVSPFVSIWAGIYWAIVTGTTVGYGDFYPTSVGGRFISCFWIFAGILVLGIPISIIGSNFGIELEKRKKYDDERRSTLMRLRESSRQRESGEVSVSPSMLDAMDQSTVTTESPLTVAIAPTAISETRKHPKRNTQDIAAQTPPEWAMIDKIRRLKSALRNQPFSAPTTPSAATAAAHFKVDI